MQTDTFRVQLNCSFDKHSEKSIEIMSSKSFGSYFENNFVQRVRD